MNDADIERGHDTDSLIDSHTGPDLDNFAARGTASSFVKIPGSAAVHKGLGGFIVLFIFFIAVTQGIVLGAILSICLGSIFVIMFLVNWMLEQSMGDIKSNEIGDAIREGSSSFFQRVYGTIFRLSLPFSAFIFLLYFFRAPSDDYKGVSSFGIAVLTALSFLAGCFCSGLAGYVGLWTSCQANVRVASSAVSGTYHGTIQLALRSGAIASLIVVTLVVLGVTLLFILFVELYCSDDDENSIHFTKIPMLLVGYGFGASFNALFAQLGGGIFTKAADVGADLVGKVEKDIPEDDPRNPAVIADLVGDNVGDCSARGADLFESIAAEIISAMILGGSLSSECNMNRDDSHRYVLFPLVVHAFDLIVSTIGVFSVKNFATSHEGDSEDPLQVLKRGYKVSMGCSLFTFALSTWWMLSTPVAPYAWLYFYVCGVCGMCTAYASVIVTQYYTDYIYRPVRSIAEASTTGHATNIIAGLSVGLESTMLPVVVISVAILVSYWLGKASGLEDRNGDANGGLFGTAVATMGMLSTAAYVLSMDVFGPIADNAGGIVEMSGQPERVRDITDRLDAVGNTTKAATKGYAIGSAALACFLLFSAFMDEVSSYTGTKFDSVDLAIPEVFVGGMLGAALVFLFTSMAMNAVGEAAQEVVKEVRRQFREMPGIMTGDDKPQYGVCVDIISRAALSRMTRPGLLAVGMPIFVGVFFRCVGGVSGDSLLGARALTGFLMLGTVTGILMALFLNNAGGAWDNTKKLIETGAYGGKNSEAHKAAITGDTVGDPAKDTAGPSIHVLIKLLSTICLVMCPLFVGTA